MSADGRDLSQDTFADQAFTAAADAYMRTPGNWEQAIQAALAGLFEFLAAAPEPTRACVVEALHSGRPGLERRDRLLARFAEFLEPGYTESADPPADVVAEAVSGGVYELIRTHVVERRIDELPEALPAATVIALSPFVGSSEAERLAARPISLRADR